MEDLRYPIRFLGLISNSDVGWIPIGGCVRQTSASDLIVQKINSDFKRLIDGHQKRGN